MKHENLKVKRSLIIQSFAPLFLLLAIKYSHICAYCNLICKFFDKIKNNFGETVASTIQHPSFWEMIVFSISIAWLIVTIFIACGFRGIQNNGFTAAGEQIIVAEKETDGGAIFLVTYILPLLMDDINNWRSFLVFIALLFMIVMLLIHSKNFYNNPILSLLQYKTYTFKFVNPADDIEDANKEYVAITYGKGISEEATIRRKYITDGVFLIYND